MSTNAGDGHAFEAYGIPREHAPLGGRIVLQAFLLLDADQELEAPGQWPTASCSVDGGAQLAVVQDGNAYRATVDVGSTLGERTATWTFDGKAGAFTQTIVVVERRVASLADVNRSLNKAGDEQSYAELDRRLALQLAIDAFETETGQAFTRRSTTETVTPRDAGELVVRNSDVVSVEAIDGWTGDVAGLSFDDDAILGGYWGGGPYTVTYTHGLLNAPPDVTRAVALIASSILARGPWDDRGYSVDDGTGITRLLTAGVSGASFSIPEVQAALVRHRNPFVG